jgi:hypothetical protein
MNDLLEPWLRVVGGGGWGWGVRVQWERELKIQRKQRNEVLFHI